MEFNFKMTEQEAQYIMNLLTKQPWCEVANLISSMNNQAFEQRNIETEQSSK